MEYTIEEYISKNKIINILLSYRRESNISINEIYLYYLTKKNSDILQKIILSGKYISVNSYFAFGSYENIDILPYVNEIKMCNTKITNENFIGMIHHSTNLRKLTIQSSRISEINIKNKLCEKKLLKYIKINLIIDVNLDDVYDIMQIESINTLCLHEHLNNNNFLNHKKIFKILCYIVNNLNKNIKIIIDCHAPSIIFKKFANLIIYNFKVNNNNYIFTFVTCAFRKFDNLYDFNLCYQ